MPRATKLAVALALAVSAILVPSIAHAGAHKTTCLTAKGETLAQNGKFRVYQRIKLQPKKYYSSITTELSCSLTGHFKERQIAKWGNNADGTLDVRGTELADHYVVFKIEEETGVSDSFGLMNSDLRRGGSQSYFPKEDQEIGDFWVARGGGVLAVFAPHQTGITLHAFDASGDHLLAGAGFTEEGVSSNNAYWTEGSVLHSFTFVGAAATPK
jgi:hypothetical protein